MSSKKYIPANIININNIDNLIKSACQQIASKYGDDNHPINHIGTPVNNMIASVYKDSLGASKEEQNILVDMLYDALLEKWHEIQKESYCDQVIRLRYGRLGWNIDHNVPKDLDKIIYKWYDNITQKRTQRGESRRLFITGALGHKKFYGIVFDNMEEYQRKKYNEPLDVKLTICDN